MGRSYRASNAIYVYILFLIVDCLVLGLEGVRRFRGAAPVTGAALAVLGVICFVVAALLFVRWGRLRITVAPDGLLVSGAGNGPPQRLHWADVERVRQAHGPAYQLALRDMLPGPYLPYGLWRGETALEVLARPGTRLVFRQSLVSGYGSLRQDVLRSIPKDADVDLHVRWWHE